MDENRIRTTDRMKYFCGCIARVPAAAEMAVLFANHRCSLGARTIVG